MHVIAVDPGLATGITLFEGTGLVLSVTEEEEPYALLTNLLTDYFSLALVVCEKSPDAGRQPEYTHRVERLVEDLVPPERLTWVRPSEWKGHPKAQLTPEDEQMVSTRHERDAAKLGRWFIHRRYRTASAPV